jgi:hypothetical protein
MPVFRTVTDAQKGDIKLEAVHQPLYDKQSITAAGEKLFFQGGTSAGGFLGTNLQTQGQLSWPKRFSIKAFRLIPALGTLANDLASILNNSVFSVNVGEKNYFRAPALLITPGVGLEVYCTQFGPSSTSTATAGCYATNGRPDHHNIYGLVHPVYVPPVQNFNVSLDVKTFSLPSGAQSFDAWIFLEGELLREIQ